MKTPKPVYNFNIISMQPMHRLKSVLGYLYQILDEDTQQVSFVYCDYNKKAQSCSCAQEENKRKSLCPHIKFLQKHPTIIINSVMVHGEPEDEDYRFEPMALVVVATKE